MANEPYELPEGWRWETLAEVAEIGSMQLHPKREPERQFNYVALENVEPGTGRLVGFSPTPGSEIVSNKYVFTDEHVLYGKLRPYLRKALLPGFEGISATDLLPLRPNSAVIDRRFLWRWLLSPDVLEYSVARQTGVKMPRLRTGDLAGMPVPVPPLPQQWRLVEKIERILAQSRTAREALDRIAPLLKTFRQSVLAKAFRGELTEPDPNDEPASVLLKRILEERRRKWEEDLRAMGKDPRKAKYAEPAPPDTSALPELPGGWVWATIGEVCQDVPQLRANDVALMDFEYVDISSIDNQANAIRKTKRYGGLSAPSRARMPIVAGDVLFSTVRTYLRNIAMVAPELDGQVASTGFCVLRPVRGIDSGYLFRYVLLEAFVDAVSGLQRGISYPAVTDRDVYDQPVPVPPTTEQRLIALRLEGLLSGADTIEHAVIQARLRAEQLDQSVLARAFQGDL